MRFYKSTLLILVLLSLFLVGQAQPPCLEIEWSYNYGGSDRDWGDALVLTPDGGYLVSGYSRSSNQDVSANNGDWDVWLARLDVDGLLLWEQNYGGSNNDEATDIQNTPDGGFIFVGSTRSLDGDVSENEGEEDFWIVKLAADGALEWERSYGGTGVERAEAVRSTVDGGYIVAGFADSQNGDVGDNYGNFDAWLIKLSANGDLEWERNFGGTDADWAFDVTTTQDGGFVFAGSSFSNDLDVSDNNGFYDYWVAKIDATGTLIWEHNFGGSGEDRSYVVREADNGDLIVGGSTYSNNEDVTNNFGSSDFWLLRLAADGNLIWQRSLGGMASEWAWGIDLTMDGGIAVCGRSNTGNSSGNVSGNNGGADFWLLQLNADGDLLWERNLGGSSRDVPYAILQTPDEGFVLAGYSESSDGDVPANYGDWDYWVVKLSPRTFVLDLGPDTTLCAGQTLTLDADLAEPNAVYEWQDLSAETSFLVESEGLYQVDIQIDECRIEDSIFVSYLNTEPLDLGLDTAFCAYAPYVLDASIGNALSYVWQDGSRDPIFSVTNSGQYWVTVQIEECVLEDSIRITFNNPIVDLGPDTVKCEENVLLLQAPEAPDMLYQWQDGSDDQRLIVTDTGTYSVLVDQNGCLASDTIHIGLCEKFRDPCLDIPNAFTPNGDASNDVFGVVDYCRFDRFRLVIFNRWGERLFESADPDTQWDGTYRGQKCQQGVYVYVIEYDYTFQGVTQTEVQKGSIALIR